MYEYVIWESVVVILETIMLGAAGSGFYDLTRAAAKLALSSIKQDRPDLIEAAERAAQVNDDDALRDALIDAIKVVAGSGHVNIGESLITAVREATFDHQRGVIIIGGATIDAPVLVTGGGANATGKTVVEGDTALISSGTSIRVGSGASITLTGDATITQT